MEYTGKQRRAKWQIPFFTIWTGQALLADWQQGRPVCPDLVAHQVDRFRDGAGDGDAGSTGPEIFLGPIAGAYVDRWNRRVVMIVADSLIALASLWLAYLFWTDADADLARVRYYAGARGGRAAFTGRRCRPRPRSWCPRST